jgi:hypothetical protein
MLMERTPALPAARGRETAPGRPASGPVRVALGNTTGWHHDGDPVVVVNTTTCLSADDLVAALYCCPATAATSDLMECSADQVRELVAQTLTVEGLEAVWREVKRTRCGWARRTAPENGHWMACARRVWEAFGLPGQPPVMPAELDAQAGASR